MGQVVGLMHNIDLPCGEYLSECRMIDPVTAVQVVTTMAGIVV
jgi:hypothetical protein